MTPLASLPSIILRSEALRAIEAADHEHVLMERAGAAGVALAEKICKSSGNPILIVAGPGNNGGDALVIARHLLQGAIACHLVLAGDDAKLPADAHKAWLKFLAAGGTVHQKFSDGQYWDLVIDGIFGLGLTRDVSGEFANIIQRMQQAASRSQCPLLALDCPSGLDSETGALRGTSIRATHTLSFLGLKPGLLTNDGPDACGEVTVAALGIDLAQRPDLLANIPSGAIGHTVGRADFQEILRPRPRNSNKGSYGSAAILGGAHSMVGAALLAGRAALKTGAGRVYLGFPADAPIPVDPQQPELMLRSAESIFDAPLTAIACGPGLGQSSEARALLQRATAQNLPLVLDADALNLLASDPALSQIVAARTAATVLTPHPGEAARLLGCSITDIQEDRLGAATHLAAKFKAWIILKGCGSIIVSPQGAWWINTSGNPGLASAGTGDTLTGCVVSFLAQSFSPSAAVLGACTLHGAAADLIANQRGEIGLTASELSDAVRDVLNQASLLS